MTLESGRVIEPRTVAPVTREQLKSYSDASGDFNPIHLDEDAAKKAGLPGIIAHGMFIASLVEGRALQFIEKEIALDGFELAQFQVKFKAMTLVGDAPSIGGSVREVNSDGIVLDLQAKNQKGEVLTTGVAKFRKK